LRLGQAVERAPRKGAVRAPALQREIDQKGNRIAPEPSFGSRSVHPRALPPVRSLTAAIVQQKQGAPRRLEMIAVRNHRVRHGALELLPETVALLVLGLDPRPLQVTQGGEPPGIELFAQGLIGVVEDAVPGLLAAPITVANGHVPLV